MSDVAMNEALNEAIKASVNSADIRTAVQLELEKQGEVAAAEKLAADQPAAEAKAAAEKAAADANPIPTTFTRTELIGGKEFTFEAGNELELERMVNNAYKIAYAVRENEPQPTQQTVDPAIAIAAQKKAEEEAAVFQADLELKFKRGEITPADYIKQSGAMEKYLADQGVPLEALKAAVNQTQSTAEEQSWANAVEDFKSGPGKDWPGGEKNLEVIGLLISSKPELYNSKDKVAALSQAYQSMRSSGLIFPADAPATPATPQATAPVTPIPVAPVAPAQPVAQRTAATSSSLFGQSSGVGATGGTTQATTAGKVDVPKDASPEEIIAAWKQAQVSAGKDPNEAFKETFSARRV